MDKLSEHAIRMLEIVDANDISVIGNKQFQDIAKAVYDTILQVQMLKVADHKVSEIPTSSEKPNNSTRSKMEQVDKDINVRSKEPQTVVRLKHFKCPKCGRSDYIRSFEDWGIDGGIYKYKCINCNTYIKDEPQTDCAWK